MNVIWFSGMPRSGTNWVSQFFAASPQIRVKFCPLFSYKFKNSMSESDDKNSWRQFFNNVYATPDEFMDQLYLSREGLLPVFNDKENTPSTLLIKSNRFHNLSYKVMKKIPEMKMVGIVRDPVAAIGSWLNNPIEFPADANPIEEWRTGACRKTGPEEYWGFNDWMEVTRLYMQMEKEFSERFMLVRYEEIVGNPHRIAREIFEKMDLKYTQHVDDFIDSSMSTHVEHPRSVFRKNHDVKKWGKSLSKDIVNNIYKEIRGTSLERFIYE